MKRAYRLSAIAVLFSILWTSAKAQVNMTCTLAHDTVLQFEPIWVEFKLKNVSGRLLTLAPDHLGFEVEKIPGRFMKGSGRPLIDAPLPLRPGVEVTRRVNLLQAYGMKEKGRYAIRGRIQVGDELLLTPRKHLDVVTGFERARLVSSASRGAEMNWVLRLISLKRDHAESLFLRLDDEREGLCYGVYGLGGSLHVREPLLQVDTAGRVHVLHQTGPESYAHSIYTLNGRYIGRQNYLAAQGDIRLEANGTGELRIGGTVTEIEDPGNL